VVNLVLFFKLKINWSGVGTGISAGKAVRDNVQNTLTEMVSSRTLAWQTLQSSRKKKKKNISNPYTLYWKSILDMYGELPSQLEGLLSIDRFGNVIALEVS
jgi:hypothetical protein